MQTAGIVLAGGLSRRFGSPKAFAKWNGQFYYQRALDALSTTCQQIIVVTRPELMHRFPSEVSVTTDIEPFVGQGPLAGILSGMEKQMAQRYIVLPCDMPLVSAEVVLRLRLSHSSSVTAVKDQDRLHPLVSVWDVGTKENIRNALRKGQRRVQALQDQCQWRWIDSHFLTDEPSPQMIFKNVNTIADKKELIDWQMSPTNCNGPYEI